MKSVIREFSQSYVNWVLRLGGWKSALLGFAVLAILAIIVQAGLSYLLTKQIYANDFLRSIVFGLVSAPFVIYFFNLLVEKLEKSRIQLEQSVYDLGVLREQDAYLNATLEKNSRDKSILMATISHELRTPLNGIIGLSGILLESELSHQQREYLKTINISAISLGHIFNDIIDLEKIDSSRIELFRAPTELTQLINQVSHFANLMAEQKQIHFQIDYADDLPDFIAIDNARLSQVLWNLISNAVKFTPAGGKICLTILRNGADRFCFRIQDTGIGIPKAEQHKIFTMFYQAENSEGRKAQGSGIGLAVSKRIAQLMGGDLEVESEEKQGATFTLTIQAEVVEEASSIAIHQMALKVLLVEDIEVNVIVAKAMLEKFGCEVDVAMTGKEAFEQLDRQSYDLILLDIQLPDITGFDIAQTLRQRYAQEEMDYLPLLIALTANIMQTKEEYQAQGMDDVLRKPLSLEALATCLNTHFDSEIKMPQRAISEENDTEKPPYDSQFLGELSEVMGRTVLLNNLTLFAQTMPEYLADLSEAFNQWQALPSPVMRQRILDTAHKIKGALAAVGLTQLQQVAQLAQTDDGEAWEVGIQGWIEQLKQQWQLHLQLAEQWLKQH